MMGPQNVSLGRSQGRWKHCAYLRWLVCLFFAVYHIEWCGMFFHLSLTPLFHISEHQVISWDFIATKGKARWTFPALRQCQHITSWIYFEWSLPVGGPDSTSGLPFSSHREAEEAKCHKKPQAHKGRHLQGQPDMLSGGQWTQCDIWMDPSA